MRNFVAMGGKTKVVVHHVKLTRLRTNKTLRIALLTDLHICEPWVSLKALRRLIAQTTKLEPDLILLLGDYLASRKLPCKRVPIDHVTKELLHLKAPLGVFAIQGNHDWWDDPAAQERKFGPTQTETSFARAGLRLLQNESVPLEFHGDRIWLAGIESQWAFGKNIGCDDLPGSLANIDADDPVILMAHEPDIFHNLPSEIDLTVSGHTHAGQLNLFGYRPLTPSRYGARYAYGHYRRNHQHLIVSAGIGYSGLPLRIGAAPEITMLRVSALDC